jgi:hypothetical protein
VVPSPKSILTLRTPLAALGRDGELECDGCRLRTARRYRDGKRDGRARPHGHRDRRREDLASIVAVAFTVYVPGLEYTCVAVVAALTRPRSVFALPSPHDSTTREEVPAVASR